MNEMEKRIESEAKAVYGIKNKDMICNECEFVYDDSEKPGNASKCEMFDTKPLNVIKGGSCKKFFKKI